MTRLSLSTLSLVLVILAPALVGCGSAGGRAEVAGDVTVDGGPLETGNITFVPLGGAGISAGGPVAAGKYHISAAQGPLPGKYRVEIKGTRKTGEKIVDDMKSPPDNLVDKIEQFVPPRYNTQSELTAEISAGVNRQVNFALKVKE